MNICIVEDNTRLLASLRVLLDGEEGITVTSGHASAEEAVAAAGWERIDVLLVDLDLPQMSGVELIRHVQSANPDMSILVYTVHEDRANVLEALRAGACGYLVKGSRPRDLVEALHEIYAGGAPMSPHIARAVLREMQQAEAPDVPTDEALTPRETLALRLLEEGLPYKVIADRLGVSPHTVHTHIKRVYRKLQAHTRAEAVRKGRVRGVL